MAVNDWEAPECLGNQKELRHVGNQEELEHMDNQEEIRCVEDH